MEFIAATPYVSATPTMSADDGHRTSWHGTHWDPHQLHPATGVCFGCGITIHFEPVDLGTEMTFEVRQLGGGNTVRLHNDST